MVATAWIEVALIAIGTLLAPFVIWIAHQLRKSILEQVKSMLVENYLGLEDQIKYNRTQLNNLKTRLKHRAELASLKYNALTDKIDEIENYLEKSNGYRRRNRIQQIQSSNIDMTAFYNELSDDDNFKDDDLSMGF